MAGSRAKPNMEFHKVFNVYNPRSDLTWNATQRKELEWNKFSARGSKQMIATAELNSIRPIYNHQLLSIIVEIAFACMRTFAFIFAKFWLETKKKKNAIINIEVLSFSLWLTESMGYLLIKFEHQQPETLNQIPHINYLFTNFHKTNNLQRKIL